MRVYLAGPITGLSYGGSTEWRDAVTAELAEAGITGVSPMRAKDYLAREEVITHSYEGTVLSCAKGITARDRWDCTRCDLVLVNLLGADRVSIGTMIEVGWADAARNPIVLALEPGSVHDHPMVTEAAGFIVPTLAEAVNVIKAICAE